MTQLPKGTSPAKDDGLFDDCSICQAMRAAAARGRGPTSDELRKAFKQAKDAGGMVGGEWFDAGQER